jgi:hypothetical protein
MLIVGTQRSTDDVTPQSQIVYRVLANGVEIGVLTDGGSYSGVYGVLHLLQGGYSTVSVQAVDQAGNRSPSRSTVVWGYYTPGCAPGHL